MAYNRPLLNFLCRLSYILIPSCDQYQCHRSFVPRVVDSLRIFPSITDSHPADFMVLVHAGAGLLMHHRSDVLKI